MKRFGLFLLLAVFAVAITAATVENASALPAFSKQYVVKYKDSKGLAEAKAQKCNLCHVDKEKKTVRNEYGKALSKFVTKDDYKELKSDKEALEKKLNEAFDGAGKEKSSSGETFGARIEAGKLPAAE